jgi:hypothetical protein
LEEEFHKWTRWICPLTGDEYEMLGMDITGYNNSSELEDKMVKHLERHCTQKI